MSRPLKSFHKKEYQKPDTIQWEDPDKGNTIFQLSQDGQDFSPQDWNTIQMTGISAAAEGTFFENQIKYPIPLPFVQP